MMSPSMNRAALLGEAKRLVAALRRMPLALFARFERARDGTRMPVQAAALPWRRNRSGGDEVLLITSRRSGKWLVPKGWPMRGKSLAQAAEIEAYQEAGVRGLISPQPSGELRWLKQHWTFGAVWFLVRIYPLEVAEERDVWREQAQRRRRWLSPEEAADVVESPELPASIRQFRGHQLRRIRGPAC